MRTRITGLKYAAGLALAMSLTLGSSVSRAELVRQTGDQAIDFSAEDVERLRARCLVTAHRRLRTDSKATAFCDCTSSGIATYVPKDEWNRYVRWAQVQNHLVQDTSKAQEEFVADVAPTMAQIGPQCRQQMIDQGVFDK